MDEAPCEQYRGKECAYCSKVSIANVQKRAQAQWPWQHLVPLEID